jgi:hypothetical protein
MINELIKLVGQPYQMFFDDGNYLGCFMPMYFLYPDLPRYPLPSTDLKAAKNFRYGISKIRKDFDRIERKDLKVGDMIACKFNDELHVAIILDSDRIIHVTRGGKVKISRLHYLEDLFKSPIFFRKKNEK